MERHLTPATRQRIAELARVADEDWMQDWPLEVADAARLEEFLELLEAAEDDQSRSALMSLVLYSIDAASDDERARFWPRVAVLLERTPSLFADEIIYWSCMDTPDDEPDNQRPVLAESEHEGFEITASMRELLGRVAVRLGVQPRFAKKV